MPSRRSRLGTLAALVPPGSRVVDVGTDHGRLPRLLLSRGRASFCLATDISREALDAASRLPPDHPAAGRLEFRQADGLLGLTARDRIEVAVLAGMGARTIIGVLERSEPRVRELRRLILQPQSEADRLRRWLDGRGWDWLEERWVVDRGRGYALLALDPRGRSGMPTATGLQPEDLHRVGPLLVRSRDPALCAHWRRQLRHDRRVVEQAPSGIARTRNLGRLASTRRIVATLERWQEAAEGGRLPRASEVDLL